MIGSVNRNIEQCAVSARCGDGVFGVALHCSVTAWFKPRATGHWRERRDCLCVAVTQDRSSYNKKKDPL